VTIDYTKTKFEDVAKDVDVVLDMAGGDTLKRSYGVVKKGGIIVSIVDEVDQKELDARGIRGVEFRASPKASVLDDLTRLIDAKKLHRSSRRRFPYRRWPERRNRFRLATPVAKSYFKWPMSQRASPVYPRVAGHRSDAPT
jgi:NADPH:quinone reductase-like Zn-dependent oxidoreductase